MKARLGSNTSQKDEHTQAMSGLALILVPPSVGKEGGPGFGTSTASPVSHRRNRAMNIPPKLMHRENSYRRHISLI